MCWREARTESRSSPSAQGDQPGPGEGRPQDAGVGHDPPLFGGQGIQAGGDQRLQGGRRPEGVDVQGGPGGRHVVAVPRDDHVAVDERPDGLDGEQRDALCAADQGVTRLDGKADHEPVDERGHVRVLQRLEADHGLASTTQVVATGHELGAGQCDDEDARLGSGHHLVDEVQQAVVGKLGILDHEGEAAGRVLAHPLEERDPGGEQLLALEAGGRLGADQRSKPGPHPRTLLRVCDVEREGLVEASGHHVTGVRLGEAQPGACGFGQRPERDPVAVGQAPTSMPGR